MALSRCGVAWKNFTGKSLLEWTECQLGIIAVTRYKFLIYSYKDSSLGHYAHTCTPIMQAGLE